MNHEPPSVVELEDVRDVERPGVHVIDVRFHRHPSHVRRNPGPHFPYLKVHSLVPIERKFPTLDHRAIPEKKSEHFQNSNIIHGNDQGIMLSLFVQISRWGSMNMERLP